MTNENVVESGIGPNLKTEFNIESGFGNVGAIEGEDGDMDEEEIAQLFASDDEDVEQRSSNRGPEGVEHAQGQGEAEAEVVDVQEPEVRRAPIKPGPEEVEKH